MELLSTHGATWASLSHFVDDTPPHEIVRVASRYSNSMTVHTWPEASCILNVRAHASAVGHSVLSPDGTQLLTVSPKDGVLKMWHVWGKKERVRSRSRDSLAAKFVIR
jgi:cell division cycle 20, cofactor of APC complex